MTVQAQVIELAAAGCARSWASLSSSSPARPRADRRRHRPGGGDVRRMIVEHGRDRRPGGSHRPTTTRAGLLGSVLSLESAAERMTQIKGVVPSPPTSRPAAASPTAARWRATSAVRPAPDLVGPRTHTAACHHPAIDLVTTESETVSCRRRGGRAGGGPRSTGRPAGGADRRPCRAQGAQRRSVQPRPGLRPDRRRSHHRARRDGRRGRRVRLRQVHAGEGCWWA
ncbi:hypothetical protein ACRAWF_33780 [Streptomyces sp. L7]